jgi:hypothetical protein
MVLSDRISGALLSSKTDAGVAACSCGCGVLALNEMKGVVLVRSMCKMVLGVSLVVFALVGVVSASASAEACVKKAGAKTYFLCVAGQRATQRERFAWHLKPNTTAVLRWLPSPETSTVTCSKLTSKLVEILTNAEMRNGVLDLESCKIKLATEKSGQERCYTPKISLEELYGQFGPTAEALRLAKYGELNNYFAEWIIEQHEPTCPWKGKRYAKGVQHCTLKEPEVEVTAKLVDCPASMSELHSEGAGASLNFEAEVEREGVEKKKFSIVEG